MVEETSPGANLHQEQAVRMNQSWVTALVKEDVFEGDPSTWRVTGSNYKKVLAALNLSVQQFEQALTRAIASSNDQLIFADFCTLFQKEFMKAAAFELRSMDDTKLLETPAQKIISMLREI